MATLTARKSIFESSSTPQQQQQHQLKQKHAANLRGSLTSLYRLVRHKRAQEFVRNYCFTISKFYAMMVPNRECTFVDEKTWRMVQRYARSLTRSLIDQRKKFKLVGCVEKGDSLVEGCLINTRVTTVSLEKVYQRLDDSFPTQVTKQKKLKSSSFKKGSSAKNCGQTTRDEDDEESESSSTEDGPDLMDEDSCQDIAKIFRQSSTTEPLDS